MRQSFEERWFQQEGEEALFNFLINKPGNPLVCMPTGTGKSVVIAKFIRRVFATEPHRRIMKLTHDEKIVKQNTERLKQVWPNAPIGLYAAGLHQRERVLPIIFGMVKSVAAEISRALKENRQHFGFIDAIIIDEAHLLSPDEETKYQFIIAELKKINPYIVVIGFTATPYRLKQGLLTEGKGAIFTEICYDITDFQSINRLIAEGYMSMLLAKPTGAEIDVSGVKLVGGEFNQHEVSDAAHDIVAKACREMIEYGANRNAWMVFGASIENAEEINEELQGLGIVSTVVHSKEKQSDKRIEDYMNGMYQCIVNKDMLTTGFDHPPIDFIADMQPTMSPGKHVQKLGRGARPSPNKNNCIVLDFAGNVKRIGPFNDPKKPRPPGKSTGDVPIKVCPSCQAYNHASARNCCLCGHEFSFETKLTESAGTDAIIRTSEDVIEIFSVKKVIYNRHEKKDSNGQLTSPPSIKVSYWCANKKFDEYIMFEHAGRMRNRAIEWWKRRFDNRIPLTTSEALVRISSLPWPKQIKVITNRQYPEIIDYNI